MDETSLRSLAADLLTTLEALDARYERLHGVLRERKDCIRRGEVEGMQSCLARERELLNAIRDLDANRQNATAQLTRHTRSAVKTIDDLLPLLPDDGRERLASTRARLRARIRAVDAEYSVLKEVGGALLAHVTGLIQRLHLLGTHAALYGRDGRVGRGRPVVTGVDFRT